MPRFAEKYTDAQREAMAAAFDGGMSAPRVVELAAAGALVHDGEPLEPFEAKQSSVRSVAGTLRRRHARSDPTALVDLAPMDAVELLRRRALTGTEEMLLAEMKKPAAERDPERLKHIYRALRELQYLSGSGRKPGSPVDGKRLPADYPTRGGPAGALLADHHATDAPVHHGSPVPVEPDPAPEDVTPPETLEDRLRREMREDIEREMGRLVPPGQRDLVAASLAGSHEIADESRGSRRRRAPTEDISSCR